MKRTDRSWILVLLAAAGVGAPVAVRSRDAVAPAPAAAPTAGNRLRHRPARNRAGEPQRRDQRLREVLKDFPGLIDEGGPAAEAGDGDAFTVVASVPDPDRTDYDSFFDQTIDSIRSAARASGFLPDRYYLPWTTSSSDPDLDIQLDGSPWDWDETNPPQTVRVKHHHDDIAVQLPGVMVFRRSPDQIPPPGARPRIDLLVVFVVGETATQGIHREAMATALRLSDEIDDNRATRHHAIPRRHAVLAPFFSKSATSLRLELGAGHPGCDRLVSVISGSANGIELRADSLGETARFYTVNHSATALRDAALTALGATDKPVAALTEGTFWGRWLESDQTPESERSSREHHPAKDRGKPSRITSFEFPLHVARLRAEREKLKQESASDKTANLRTRLELHLDQDHESVDEVPVQSPLTPYGVELMLQQQLITIAREDYRYLAIVATDPADLIFLAGEARKYCPKARIFTPQANLLFAHPDVMRDLDGMLVSSTYPLSADHGYASGRDEGKVRLAFASQEAEGVFNAFSALLFELGASESDLPPLRDYVGRAAGSPPPIWISVVSNGALWPIVLDEPPTAAAASAADPAPASILYAPLDRHTGQASALPPLTWQTVHAKSITDIFYPLLSLITAGLVAIFLRWMCAARRAPRLPEDLRTDGLRYWLAVWIPVALLDGYLSSLFLVTYGTADVHVHAYAIARFWISLSFTVAAVAMVVWTTVPLVAAVARTSGQRDTLRDSGIPSVTTLLIGSAIGGLAIRYFWSFVGPKIPAANALLAIDRTLQPLSGVSPGLPLLFLAAGFGAFGYAGLIRVRDQHRFPDTTPFPSDEGLSSVGLGELAEGIRTNRAARLFTPHHIFGLSAAALLDLYFWVKLDRTLEPGPYDPLFRAGFLTLLTLTILAVGRLTAAWFDLRRLLSRLAGHPMIEAYDRVGSQAVRAFEPDIGAQAPSDSDRAIAVRMAVVLGRVPPPVAKCPSADVLGAQIKSDAAQAVQLYERAARGAAEDPRTGTQATLFRLARNVFAVLERLWNGEGDADGAQSIQRLVDQVSPTDAKNDGPYRHVPTLALHHQAAAPGAQIWQRLAEDLVASQIVTLLNLALGRIRGAMAFGTTGALLLVCATTSYAFHPTRFVAPFAWLVALSIMIVILSVVVGIERDDVLSRIAQTQPGRVELNPAFLGRVAIYGALPAMALVVSNFPEMGAVVLAWVEPLLRALH